MRLLVIRFMVAIARARIVLPGLAATIVLTCGHVAAQQHVHKAGVAHDVPDFAVNATTGNVFDNFRVYYKEQAPTFTIPQSGPDLVGAPAPGLTNFDAWSRYKVAIAGSVAPCQTSRPGFDGFTCGIK
jgi:hypothetical protein